MARWALLLIVLAGLAARGFGARPEGGEAEGIPEIELRIHGRLQIGLPRIAARAGQEARGTTSADFHVAFDSRARSLKDRLRLIPLAGEILGPGAALERISASPQEDEVLGILRPLYGEEARRPTEAEAELLRRRLGWPAEVALVHGLPDDDPARAAFLRSCERAVVVLGLATIAFVVVACVSLVLFLAAMVKLLRRRLPCAESALPRGGANAAWLEVPLLLLLGVLLFSFLPSSPWSLVPLALTPFWPLARGLSLREWRDALALRPGSLRLREVGAGIVGYLATLPLVALGFLLMLLIVRWTGLVPTHPYVEEAQREGGPGAAALLVAACLWAPLVEEAAFRGALWHHVRGHRGILPAALVTGLVFGLAHPQGLAALPVLATLGAVFGLLRHWRGSLVAPITAHALHNGVLLGLFLAIS